MLEIDKSRESRRLLVYVLSIFFLVVLIMPIATLFKEAFFMNGEFVGISNFITYFSTPALFKSFGNSIFVSSVTSVIVVFLGFIFAYAVERCDIKFKRTINFIALLPLFIPTMTHAIALIYLLGENGVLTTGFLGKIPGLAFDFPLYGKWGVIIAECFFVFPAIYMMFSVAFRVCDYRLYEAAEMLDTSKPRVFFTITLPAVKYTIISAFLSYDEGIIASTAAIAVMILITNLVVKYGIEFYKMRSEADQREKDMYIYRTIQIINEQENLSQRKLAEQVGVSLGKVNSIIRECVKNEWICKKQVGKTTQYEVTEKGFELLRHNIELIKEDRIQISKDSSEKVKSAVILAAGERGDFDVSPAGLKIEDTTLIKQTIRKLRENGVTKIIVVLGYGREVIAETLRDEEGVIIVESINYNESGSMDSLALASKHITEDFILVEGDLLFESRALKKLIDTEKRECILITEVSGSKDEEFVQLKNGYLFKLGKDIHQFNRVDGELVGISKISYKLFELMMKEYKENMNELLNYEYILLDVARDFKVSSLMLKDLKWGEIDNKEQYQKVIEIFNNMK